MESLPRTLFEAFDPAEGQGVVCFVGSGPSIHAGLPSWPDLLRVIARDIDVESEIVPALDAGRYLEVAQFFVSIKGEKSIQGHVAEIIRQASKTPGELHRLIASVPFNGIITTNYDLLLSDADLKRFFERPITQQNSGLTSHLRRKFMLHLHGHIDDPSSIVLTKSSYDQFALGLSSGAIQFIRTVFHTRTVLFVGFGFRDHNIDSILRDLQALDVTTGWNIYAIIPVYNPEDPEKVLDAALRHRNVHPIYIEAGNDHGVFALVQWIDAFRKIVERFIRARSNPVSKTPQAVALSSLAHVLDREGYGEALQSVLGKFEGRPDLIYISELRREVALSDLLERLDSSEMRTLLINVNKIRRHPLIEDVLACFPPRP